MAKPRYRWAYWCDLWLLQPDHFGCRLFGGVYPPYLRGDANV